MTHSTALAEGLTVCRDIKQWDDFCYSSPEGTHCMMSWFTNICLESAERYFWVKNGSPQAAIFIPLDKQGVPHREYFGTYQNSLCWSPEFQKLPEAQRINQQFEVLTSIIAALTAKYKHLYFFFHPHVMDVRPLLWHNYHEPQNGTFKINIRYTAVSDLTNLNSIDDVVKTARDGRKWDYKKFTKATLSISTEIDVPEFMDLYKKTFIRQGINISNEVESIVTRMIESINSQPSPETKGFILTARAENQQPVSSAVISTSGTCAYYLFAANDPDFRETGAGTALVFESMLRARNLGKTTFDFGGVNSPNRGDFKLSFNSTLRPYFEGELIYP